MGKKGTLLIAILEAERVRSSWDLVRKCLSPALEPPKKPGIFPDLEGPKTKPFESPVDFDTTALLHPIEALNTHISVSSFAISW